MSAWVFAAGLFVLLVAISIGTVRSGQLLRVWTPSSNLLLSVGDNVLRLVLVGLSSWWGVWAGPGPQALGFQTTHLGQNLLIGAIAGFVLALVVNAAGRAAMRRWGQQVFSSRMIMCMIPANRSEWIGVSLALLPAAALEELLFRSLPLGGLGWLISPWWLLWPLSLVFGLLHWPQGGWGGSRDGDCRHCAIVPFPRDA